MALSLKQFIDNVSQSGLLSAEELTVASQSLADNKSDDVQELAKLLVRQKKLTKYQASSIYQGKGKSLVFGDYVVLDKIGEGGMGVVLKAQHRRMKRIVAVKVLPAKAMDSEDAVQRFFREVEAAAKLIHPNIVTAFDAGEHRGMHYLVMEFIDGRDLSEILADVGPLPVEQAVECIIQAARGLEFAHNNGIVHRDIKPANLLLTKDGTIKILDMGLARLTGEIGQHDQTQAGQLTQSGQIMGTVDYMAPEQAMDTRTADHRADIYALGCTLFRLLTGQNVYEAATVMKRLMAHQQRDIPCLRDKRADAPAALEHVFQRMVAKEPNSRQQSMNKLIEELRAAMSVDRPPERRVSSEPSSDGALTDFFANMSATKESTATKPKAQQTTATDDETVDYKTGVEETGDRLPRISDGVRAEAASTPMVERHTKILAKKEIAQRSNQRQLIWLAVIGVPLCIAGLLGLTLLIVRAPEAKRDKQTAKSMPSGRQPDLANYALQFDGQTGYVDCGNPVDLNVTGNSVSVEAWIRPTESKTANIVGKSEIGRNDYSLGVVVSGGALLADFYVYNGTSEARAVSTTAILLHQWTHIAGLYDGANVRLVVNGRFEGSTPFSSHLAGTDKHFMIGNRRAGDYPFQGQIDEVRVSRVARYTGDFIPPQPHERFEVDDDTLALYHFDEGPGSKIARDATGKHDGTIRNAEYVRIDEVVDSSGEHAPAISVQVTQLGEPLGIGDPARSVAFSPGDGRLLAAGNVNGLLKIWDTNDLANPRTIDANFEGDLTIETLRFSPDGDWLAAATNDGVYVIDAEKGEAIERLEGANCGIWSPDGALLAAAWYGKQFQVYDTQTWQPKFTLPQEGTHEIAFTLDGNTLVAAGSGQKAIKWWKMSDGSPIHTLSDARHIALSSNGLLAAETGRELIQFWDQPDTPPTRFAKPEHDLTRLVFSPDGRLLAAGYLYGPEAVDLFDAATGLQVARIAHPTKPTYDIAFTPDGKRLATACEDGQVRLFEITVSPIKSE